MVLAMKHPEQLILILAYGVLGFFLGCLIGELVKMAI